MEQAARDYLREREEEETRARVGARPGAVDAKDLVDVRTSVKRR